MKKTKISMGISLLAVMAGTLTACGPKKGEIEFWSSFGATYKNQLNPIVDRAALNANTTVTHISKGSYPEIKTAMISAVSSGKYPNLAMGYPDHFAMYIGSDVLHPLDGHMSQELLNDYYPEYLEENYFYDVSGERHLFALPFNKSTEVLGYNGTFVEWCKTKNPELGTLPETWDQWAEKGPLYRTIYDELLDNKSCVYGYQDVEGNVTDLVAKGYCGDTDDDNRILLLDFRTVDKNQTYLMSWDATDNAFITLVKQWGAEYTSLPESEQTKHPYFRTGNLEFSSSKNKAKVIDCLKFFKKLNEAKIFGIPSELGGQFSSDAFASGNVMFMVCSSGGLSYNTKTWHSRFRVAPIPYRDVEHKYVISQGANICITDKGNYDKAFEFLKQITTGELQTKWCMSTGYYPCSKSAAESVEYQNFINEDDPEVIAEAARVSGLSVDEIKQSVYSSPARVAFREGSAVNTKIYMDKEAEHVWTKFVDPAFIGSSAIRDVVGKALLYTINSEGDVNADKTYQDVINRLINDDTIKSNTNINVVQ